MYFFIIIIINNFRGDLSDSSAVKTSLPHTGVALFANCAETPLQKDVADINEGVFTPDTMQSSLVSTSQDLSM